MSKPRRVPNGLSDNPPDGFDFGAGRGGQADAFNVPFDAGDPRRILDGKALKEWGDQLEFFDKEETTPGERIRLAQRVEGKADREKLQQEVLRDIERYINKEGRKTLATETYLAALQDPNSGIGTPEERALAAQLAKGTGTARQREELERVIRGTFGNIENLTETNQKLAEYLQKLETSDPVKYQELMQKVSTKMADNLDRSGIKPKSFYNVLVGEFEGLQNHVSNTMSEFSGFGKEQMISTATIGGATGAIMFLTGSPHAGKWLAAGTAVGLILNNTAATQATIEIGNTAARAVPSTLGLLARGGFHLADGFNGLIIGNPDALVGGTKDFLTKDLSRFARDTLQPLKFGGELPRGYRELQEIRTDFLVKSVAQAPAQIKPVLEYIIKVQKNEQITHVPTKAQIEAAAQFLAQTEHLEVTAKANKAEIMTKFMTGTPLSDIEKRQLLISEYNDLIRSSFNPEDKYEHKDFLAQSEVFYKALKEAKSQVSAGSLSAIGINQAIPSSNLSSIDFTVDKKKIEAAYASISAEYNKLGISDRPLNLMDFAGTKGIFVIWFMLNVISTAWTGGVTAYQANKARKKKKAESIDTETPLKNKKLRENIRSAAKTKKVDETYKAMTKGRDKNAIISYSKPVAAALAGKTFAESDESYQEFVRLLSRDTVSAVELRNKFFEALRPVRDAAELEKKEAIDKLQNFHAIRYKLDKFAKLRQAHGSGATGKISINGESFKVKSKNNWISRFFSFITLRSNLDNASGESPKIPTDEGNLQFKVEDGVFKYKIGEDQKVYIEVKANEFEAQSIEKIKK